MSLAKTCSIGLRSGEYLGRNTRRVPDPGERTRARAAEATERNAKRADRPQILAETKPGKVKVRSLGPSHSDHRAWQETMLDAFGTTSLDFMSSELKRLDSVHRNGNEPYSNKQDLNAALAAIAGAKPENEIESMLVAQMATTHALAMRELGLARRAEFQAQHDAHGSLGVKLLRTFTMQAEALSKLKRGGELSGSSTSMSMTADRPSLGRSRGAGVTMKDDDNPWND